MQTEDLIAHLTHAEPKRLARAVDGIHYETMAITWLHESEHAISARLENVRGQGYEVTLQAGLMTCPCPDASHRQLVRCKHGLATALHVLRERLGAAQLASLTGVSL